MENTNLFYFNAKLWIPILEKLLSKTISFTCTNQNFTGEIKNQGDEVNLPNNDKLLITQKKFFAFKIGNVAQVQASADIMEAHLTNAQKAIEEVQDSYLLGLHTDVLETNTVGSEEAPVTLYKSTIYENFVQLSLALKNSDAVHPGVRPWVVINPNIEAYLLQSPEFINAYKVADETLREGAIGRIAGMDVLVSTNLADVDSKYYVLAGTNDAITFASQLAKIESLRDKDSFSDLVRGLYLYGAKTVQPKALAKMIVSVPAAA